MAQGLSAHHISKIKYDFIELTGGIRDLMGRPPMSFIGVIYGDNGNGKTALYFMIAEQLQKFGRVEAWSYEQGHGPDMQEAQERHKVKENKWDFIVYDPFKKRNLKQSLFEEFYEHVAKPKSAKFYIIDSIDACGFTKDDIIKLYERFGGKKTFIFLSFEGANKKPLTSAARFIGGMGDYIIRVSKFVATVQKSRYGGWVDYVIWLEKAMQLNPMYFAAKEGNEPVKGKKGKKVKG